MLTIPVQSDIFSLEKVYQAYLKCRRHKRNTVNVAKFEQNLEQNLIKLSQELTSGHYAPGPSIAFLVNKPKKREIFAADFRDRIVHHILVGSLERDWEKRFIYDSYACRKEKGNLAAVRRTQVFLGQVTSNNTRPAWYLQMDIKGYFVAIDHNILYQRLVKYCAEPAVLQLLGIVLFHDVTADCRIKGARRADFMTLPEHKTLFKAPCCKGLPIGNLTSQFFGNVYLDALDQYVKHTLRARYYVRYCDDIVLLSHDQQQLVAWQAAIETFVRTKLKLDVNDRTRLRPVSSGIDFLGYVIRPQYLLCRRRVKAALYERLGWAERELGINGAYPWHWQTLATVHQWLVSYDAHFQPAATYRLWQAMQTSHAWLSEYFIMEQGNVAWRVDLPTAFVTLRDQVESIATKLPNDVLLVQVGFRWYVVESSKVRQAWAEISCNRPDQTIRLVLAAHKPLAIIIETGERATTVNTRALFWHLPTPTRELLMSIICAYNRS